MTKTVFVLVALLLLAGCSDSNLLANDAALCTRGLSGFWFGLWNGFTVCVSLVGSLFDPSIAIYDVCNNGGWYDFGFALGVGALSGGGVTVSRRQ